MLMLTPEPDPSLSLLPTPTLAPTLIPTAHAVAAWPPAACGVPPVIPLPAGPHDSAGTAPVWRVAPNLGAVGARKRDG